ncbi:hypothetical protein PVK06_039182 [Gossypium arboreum]|uniref:Reverse transcriptase domain-containing protein n=1 Tax=Gossypium arboreum TaxID=29729 RepID=A0ABR0N2F8_GOSAR|nr:hypothetical protein PVK06_039182 [Gossypium arboreum]
MTIKINLEKAYDYVRRDFIEAFLQAAGHSIKSTIGSGNWTPIRLARNAPPLSHLFFADDLILFGQAYEYQARVVKRVLDEFYEISGHQINM